MATLPSAPNLLVRVVPNPGKEALVAERQAWLTAQVKEHEPWTSMYRVLEARDLEGKLESYHVVFRVDDMSKLAERRNMPHHQQIAKWIKDDDMLKEPLRYIVLKERESWMR